MSVISDYTEKVASNSIVPTVIGFEVIQTKVYIPGIFFFVFRPFMRVFLFINYT